MIEFGTPWVFALSPLPLLIYFLLPKQEDNRQAVRVPFFERASQATAGKGAAGNASNRSIRWCALTILWISLLLSAANPLRVGESQPVATAGRDMLLAVDISGSMSTADMDVQGERISRIVVVKYILGDFLENRIGDRVGLILFGTNAYLQAPLTFDLKTVKQYLDETTLRLAGERTAIGDAIGLAVKRLKDRPESQRVLVLLTDGENTAGNIEPRQAADLAAQAGIKIYTVGVGADAMQVSRGFFGGSRTINPSAELDEGTLTYIAETTGGLYFRARDPQELQGIYQKLDELEKIEQDEASFRPVQSLYFYPLAVAFISATLLFLAINFSSSIIALMKNIKLDKLIDKTEQAK